MHVIHFCPSQSFSGLEQYALNLAVWQKKHSEKKVSFVVAPDSRLERECKAQGIDAISFSGALALSQKLWALLKHFPDEKFIFHLHTTHELYNAFLPMLMSMLSLGLKRPKVIMQFHLWITHKKKDPFHFVLYQFVDEIWCSSERASQSLAALLPVSSEKLRIIRYGRPVDEMEKRFLSRTEARDKLGIPHDVVAFMNLANLHPLKGQKELIEAFKEIASESKDLHLYLIGGARPNDSEATHYEGELKKMIELDIGLHERVHLKPALENASLYFKAFDVFVLPSYLECFSLAMLDAQLAGLPMVGTNAGGTPDVVIEGKTGWLAEPENVVSLEHALERSLFQRDQWKKMGEVASLRVRQEFNQADVFKGIDELYEGLF